jgi:putative intracellular protease/amidase
LAKSHRSDHPNQAADRQIWFISASGTTSILKVACNSGKPVAAVCRSPAVLHRVTYNGAPIVKGKRVTGLTNGEKEAVHLTKVVPFLVEDELKRLGGLYEKGPDWSVYTVVDGRLITGQNPASSGPTAKELVKLLQS